MRGAPQSGFITLIPAIGAQRSPMIRSDYAIRPSLLNKNEVFDTDRGTDKLAWTWPSCSPARIQWQTMKVSGPSSWLHALAQRRFGNTNSSRGCRQLRLQAEASP